MFIHSFRMEIFYAVYFSPLFYLWIFDYQYIYSLTHTHYLKTMKCFKCLPASLHRSGLARFSSLDTSDVFGTPAFEAELTLVLHHLTPFFPMETEFPINLHCWNLWNNPLFHDCLFTETLLLPVNVCFGAFFKFVAFLHTVLSGLRGWYLALKDLASNHMFPGKTLLLFWPYCFRQLLQTLA